MYGMLWLMLLIINWRFSYVIIARMNSDAQKLWIQQIIIFLNKKRLIYCINKKSDNLF